MIIYSSKTNGKVLDSDRSNQHIQYSNRHQIPSYTDLLYTLRYLICFEQRKKQEKKRKSYRKRHSSKSYILNSNYTKFLINVSMSNLIRQNPRI